MLRVQGLAPASFLSVQRNWTLKMPCQKAMQLRAQSLGTNAGTNDSLDAKSKTWLLVGLGNPGKLYEGTRHNVGFQMIDAISQAEGIPLNTVKFRAVTGRGYIADVPVILAKPQTFMNLSGDSVGSIVSYYKLPVSQVLLIYDDMDLPFGKLRLLPKGGHGGHNGMRSVINNFKGNREFPRLRIGIGRPPGKMDPANFVLRPFSKYEREEIEETIRCGLEAVQILVTHGVDKSANFVNGAQRLTEKC